MKDDICLISGENMACYYSMNINIGILINIPGRRNGIEGAKQAISFSNVIFDAMTTEGF